MGKLNIAHHKSYHPYRRDNIERVRRDEEEAAIKEAREEGRMALADAEARISLLRERAGASTSAKERRREDEKREQELLRQATDVDARAAAASSQSLAGALGNGKHINLFEDLEQTEIQNAISRTRALENASKGKGKEASETEKGIPLAPSAKDLKPWYSEKSGQHSGEHDEGRRTRDLSHKSRSDPLTAIQRELAARYPSTRGARPGSDVFDKQAGRWGAPYVSDGKGSETVPARAERESRESSERARAQDLKARKRREMAGSATPSTVRADVINDDGYLYANQFNAHAVAEAHRWRDKHWDQDDDQSRSRGRGRVRDRERFQRR